MHNLLTWIGYGLGAVLFAACVVAWYEHLGRATRRQDEPDWESPPPPRVVTVDIELEPTAPGDRSDQDQRRQALGGALARMSGDGSARFCDTTPMILPGKAADSSAGNPTSERRQRNETAAG